MRKGTHKVAVAPKGQKATPQTGESAPAGRIWVVGPPAPTLRNLLDNSSPQQSCGSEHYRGAAAAPYIRRHAPCASMGMGTR